MKSTVLGVGALGFGILLLWSAYTKKPLFGPTGLLHGFFSTQDFASAGAAVRKATPIFGGDQMAIDVSPKIVTVAKSGVPGAYATPPGGTVYDV